jgi:hypothetical protein
MFGFKCLFILNRAAHIYLFCDSRFIFNMYYSTIIRGGGGGEGATAWSQSGAA